ncbi:hypothetical protein CCO03_08640 [Comamonas serinivorans]|uniref:Uncharacterized protein n=1 Tax=Comamonas serinivorans TaxID=1082851 RepID=A0A1Y0EM57_9BURK|nr:hypothetical protein [Comamonas serinivorans]ARU04734.1 hypothetical protein CCO03_08640 [Comamonas serinivorans]
MKAQEMNVPGYEKLAEVLQAAYEQAAGGKGHERHANGLPFHEQPMQTINREQGSIDGFLFQARKKAIEARGLPAPRAQAELLGAINYLAGAVIALDTWGAGTLPVKGELADSAQPIEPIRAPTVPELADALMEEHPHSAIAAVAATTLVVQAYELESIGAGGVQPLRSKPDLVSLPVVDPESKPWYPDDRNWIEVPEGCVACPVDHPGVMVDVLLREEREERDWYSMREAAESWWWEDVVAYTTEVPNA